MKLWLAAGALNGFIGVALGAFAAHILRDKVERHALEPRLFEVWEVGVRYQMYHALALVAVALLRSNAPSNLLDAAGWAFLIGIILFSGSLYAMTLSHVRALGAITPLGGVAFLAGWVMMGMVAFRLRR